MKVEQFYEHLLNYPGLRIHSVDHDDTKITLHCETTTGESICPQCGLSTGEVHQYDRRRVRDLDISGKEVWLELRVRQFVCRSCNRYFHEQPDWLLPGKSYTRRQAKWAFLMCQKQAFTAAALLNMCPKTLERLYYEQGEKLLNLPQRYQEVRQLGIDEISHRKGKGDYVCVLTDLERGIQLDILPDRKKATLKAHFEQLGPQFCQQIEVVACDIWPTYINVSEEVFPHATVVIDRFHVVKALNEVLDKERKALRRKYPQNEYFKHLKWTLFKRPENCTQAQLAQLEQALEEAWELEEIYQLRNTFNAIFDLATHPLKMKSELKQWIKHAKKLNHKPMNAFLKTLNNRFKQITAFAQYRVTNAITEGLNNVIRYFKRISFGIPNFRNMRLRILIQSI
jgi:transposase